MNFFYPSWEVQMERQIKLNLNEITENYIYISNSLEKLTANIPKWTILILTEQLVKKKGKLMLSKV
jgi:hypothetical protein